MELTRAACQSCGKSTVPTELYLLHKEHVEPFHIILCEKCLKKAESTKKSSGIILFGFTRVPEEKSKKEFEEVAELFSLNHVPCEDPNCVCNSERFKKYWEKANIGMRNTEEGRIINLDAK